MWVIVGTERGCLRDLVYHPYLRSNTYVLALAFEQLAHVTECCLSTFNLSLRPLDGQPDAVEDVLLAEILGLIDAHDQVQSRKVLVMPINLTRTSVDQFALACSLMTTCWSCPH